MLSANKLKGKLVERDITVTKMSEILKMNPSTFYRKIKNNSFKIAEADVIVRVLSLTTDEANEIFFNQLVA